jgi:hypothetical protein
VIFLSILRRQSDIAWIKPRPLPYKFFPNSHLAAILTSMLTVSERRACRSEEFVTKLKKVCLLYVCVCMCVCVCVCVCVYVCGF